MAGLLLVSLRAGMSTPHALWAASSLSLSGTGTHLHGVTGVLVVEDEGLLDELVIPLQLVNVGLVVDDVLLVLLQVVHLVLKGTADVHRDVANLLPRETAEHRGALSAPGCGANPPREQVPSLTSCSRSDRIITNNIEEELVPHLD